MGKIYTVNEVAKILKVDSRTVRKLMEAWNTRTIGWISVKVDLPEPKTTILYYTGGGVRLGVCGHKEWFAGITHWMPLPAPPEEEGKK